MNRHVLIWVLFCLISVITRCATMVVLDSRIGDLEWNHIISPWFAAGMAAWFWEDKR